MKSILKCVLSLFILFSTIDLSIINLPDNFCPNITKNTSISELIKIEYDLFYQTKNVVTNVCNNIAKDVQVLLTSKQNDRVFFDIGKSERKIYIDNYFNYVKVLLLISVTKTGILVDKTKFLLFFFGFIFIFILKYLGLLFTFGKIAIYQRYKKAYII